MTEPSDLAKRIWREAVNARFYHSPPSGDTAAARVIDSYLPGPDDVEKVARALCEDDPNICMGDARHVVAQRVNAEWREYVRSATAAIAALRGEA